MGNYYYNYEKDLNHTALIIFKTMLKCKIGEAIKIKTNDGEKTFVRKD